MAEICTEIKQGIKLHLIKTDSYKTDLTCVILTVPLNRDTVTTNALIPFMLKMGSNNYPSQYVINSELDNMYGATFNCGVDKYGDNIVLKFYIESINDDYTFDNEKILQKCVNMLLDIVFNPVKKEGKLDESILEIEKNNLKKIIESKIDDKDLYALDNCISTMYGDKGFGLYKYGYVEDIDDITIDKVSEYYEWLKNNAKIDIFISGNVEDNIINKYLFENENIKKLEPRVGNYILNNESTERKQIVEKEKAVTESMNVSQGKLVIGLDIIDKIDNFQATALVYNSILGDGASSMLFQNVREKEGLAYSARSTFIKQKLNIFIRCGIQIENYDKALDTIRLQLENIRSGKFTDENIENAKAYLVSGIRNVEEEQDTEVVYYIGQEISKTNITLDEYIEKINKVTREDIINLANLIKINTIYFLRS